MHYKTIVLELLRERTELHEQLRKSDRLLPALETYAQELKNSHELWKETLFLMRPGSDPNQIASEAMEMALKELEEGLPPASQEENQEPLSLDAAIAFIRRPTSPG